MARRRPPGRRKINYGQHPAANVFHLPGVAQDRGDDRAPVLGVPELPDRPPRLTPASPDTHLA